MAAIILEKFRTHNAKEFIADFGDSSNYIFIGRSHSWTDDNEPPAPANSESEEVRAFEDMIALKKIATTDVSHGLVRYNWTSGTVYDEYRDDYSSSNQTPSGANNFYDGRGYVVTSDYKVYKCLKTGKTGGAFYDAGTAQGSTVEPSSVSTTDPQITADGYIWKFMYQMSANDVIKYVTNDFVPVKTIGAKTNVAGSGGAFGVAATDDGSAQWDIENDAVDGAIYRYIITAAGSGYNNGSATTFDLDVNVEGDGSGAVATLSFQSGALSSVTFKDTSSYGSGYKRASFPTLDSTISGLTAGTGATLRAVISPIQGHGANPIDELGGNYVVLNSRLEFGDGAGDFPTDNDFRQIGLIKNPVANGGAIAVAQTLTATRKLTLTDATNVSVDDIIRDVASASEDNTTAVARVISKTGNIIKVQTIANSGGEFVNFVNNDDVFIGSASSKETDVTAAGVDSAHPEVERFTGQILYVENRGPVSRAADQIEDIKLIIEM
jgi:hypothetical protein